MQQQPTYVKYLKWTNHLQCSNIINFYLEKILVIAEMCNFLKLRMKSFFYKDEVVLLLIPYGPAQNGHKIANLCFLEIKTDRQSIEILYIRFSILFFFIGNREARQ